MASESIYRSVHKPKLPVHPSPLHLSALVTISLFQTVLPHMSQNHCCVQTHHTQHVPEVTVPASFMGEDTAQEMQSCLVDIPH